MNRSRFQILMACTWAVMVLFVLSGVKAADAPEEESADPLGDVTQDMKAATRWLAKTSTDALTQETQQDAVHKLDVLIARLEKQRQQMNGSSASRNPTQAMRDSMVHSGPGGIGKLHDTNDNGKKWAELPAHERERILQSMTDGFPAHYQGVLEQYFKRLAEEQPLKADEQASPASATSPMPDSSATDMKPSATADASSGPKESTPATK